MDDFEILLCEAQQLVSSIACNAEGLRMNVKKAGYEYDKFDTAGFDKAAFLFIKMLVTSKVLQHCWIIIML
jgi:hypothetical protein